MTAQDTTPAAPHGRAEPYSPQPGDVVTMRGYCFPVGDQRACEIVPCWHSFHGGA